MDVLRGLGTVLSSALPVATRTPEGGGLRAATATGGESRSATPREEAALQRTRLLATLLDDAIEVPGTNYRVGIDPILGILPVGGDAVAAVLSLYPVLEAYRLGAGAWTLTKMLLVIAVDAVVGSVPVLGTIFDAFWKANRRNARIVESLVEGV